MSQWTETNKPRPPENPRRVIGGFKFKRKQGIADFPWTVAPLFDAVIESADEDAIAEGGSYAVSGQTVSFPCTVGRLDAMVQGRSSRPYALSMTFAAWTPDEWDKVIAALCSEAVFSARFLVGEMPHAVVPLITELGIKTPLVPSKPGSKATSDPMIACACGQKQPCKHAVAVTHLLAERLETEPLLLFQFRGMPVARLMERLQEQRTLATRGENQAHPLPPAATDHSLDVPLENMLHDFWRPGPRLHDLESRPIPTHTPHAILRRLGASPLGGRFPLVGLLATIYDTIRTRALAIRDAQRDSSESDTSAK